jgi:hypothetical protein
LTKELNSLKTLTISCLCFFHLFFFPNLLDLIKLITNQKHVL